jgi:hypothetical protein
MPTAGSGVAARILGRLDELAIAAASGDGDRTGQWANDEGAWLSANLSSVTDQGNALDGYAAAILVLLQAVSDGSDQTTAVNDLLAMRDDIAALAGLPAKTPTATAAPTSPPAKPVSYATLSSRAWKQLVKAPDRYVAKGYRLWACISQFDAATGEDSFRAQASYRKEPYWWSDGVNSFFTGDAARLAPFVESDLVVVNVTGAGSYSYDTQSGGNTTVPLFEVHSIKRLGSC